MLLKCHYLQFCTWTYGLFPFWLQLSAWNAVNLMNRASWLYFYGGYKPAIKACGNACRVECNVHIDWCSYSTLHTLHAYNQEWLNLVRLLISHKPSCTCVHRLTVLGKTHLWVIRGKEAFVDCCICFTELCVLITTLWPFKDMELFLVKKARTYQACNNLLFTAILNT